MTTGGVDALVEALGAGWDRGEPASRRLTAVSDRIRAHGVGLPLSATAAEVCAWAGAHRGRRRWLADRIRVAVGALAVEGTAPRSGRRREAWRAAIAMAAALHPASVHRVPIGQAVGPEILGALTREAARRRPRRLRERTRYAAPGPILQRLAVDPLLRAAVSEAAGFMLRPAYTAVYMYDPPGSAVAPHLDTSHFDAVLHIVLTHEGHRPGHGSALVVHGVDRRRRLPLRAGEAVLLCGRGAVHQWEPLGPAEQRTMLAIGFTPVRRH